MSGAMKKLTALFTIMILAFTSIGSVAAAPLFQDVSDKHFAKAELAFLVEQGIIEANPTGNFGVGEDITRLDASKMMIKALGLSTDNRPAPDFIDISPQDADYAVIATIADAGIMTGNEKKEFNPNGKLTRAQMAKVLTNAFELSGTSTYSFRDVNETHWSSDFVKTLFANGVTTGYENNTYKPQSPISKAHFSIFLARLLNPDFKRTISCHTPDNTATYVVNVAVTTLWKNPNKTRMIDRPAVSNPVDLEKWTTGMKVSEKEWLIGKVDSQALLGDEVVILKRSGDWIQIAVKDQYHPTNKTGYPGWIPKNHIAEIYPNYKNCEIAVISENIATLYNAPIDTEKFMDVSYMTTFPILKEDDEWLHVQTPTKGVKFLRKQDAKIVENMAAIPAPTQEDIVESAKMFLDLPYLWAGTSGFGFDCSGLTYTIYKNHGIVIPRDSGDQATHGTSVMKKDMQPGDLLFFAHNRGKGKVYHVGMYIGDNQMIHAPNSHKKIEIISVNIEPYKTNFAGAKRYLK